MANTQATVVLREGARKDVRSAQPSSLRICCTLATRDESAPFPRGAAHRRISNHGRIPGTGGLLPLITQTTAYAAQAPRAIAGAQRTAQYKTVSESSLRRCCQPFIDLLPMIARVSDGAAETAQWTLGPCVCYVATNGRHG